MTWLCITLSPRMAGSGRESAVYLNRPDSIGLVVLAAEVGDLVLAHHPAQGVLQFGQLHEEIVFGMKPRGYLRALVIEAQPFLDPTHPGPLSEIGKQYEV